MQTKMIEIRDYDDGVRCEIGVSGEFHRLMALIGTEVKS